MMITAINTVVALELPSLSTTTIVCIYLTPNTVVDAALAVFLQGFSPPEGVDEMVCQTRRFGDSIPPETTLCDREGLTWRDSVPWGNDERVRADF